jgi:hypothetical protein
MRNLVLTCPSVERLQADNGVTICLARDPVSDASYVLFSNGIMHVMQHGSHFATVDVGGVSGGRDCQWFAADYIVDINSVVCLSHSGLIVAVNGKLLTIKSSVVI